MTNSDFGQLVEREIEQALDQLSPERGGRVSEARLRAQLELVAQRVAGYSRDHVLINLLDAGDVAVHFGISRARARALLQNRHERFGVGRKVGGAWIIAADELGQLEPEEKYRR